MPVFIYILSLLFLTTLSTTNFVELDLENEKTCTEYAQKKKDEITGREVIISKNKLKLQDKNSGKSFNLLISRQGFEMIFVFSSDDKTCILKDTPVTMTFKGGGGKSFNSSNPGNCKGQLNLSFGGIYGNLNDLMKVANSALATISFMDKTEKPITLKLDSNQQQQLKNTIDCVMSASM